MAMITQQQSSDWLPSPVLTSSAAAAAHYTERIALFDLGDPTGLLGPPQVAPGGSIIAASRF